MPSGYTHMCLARTFREESGLIDHDLGLLLDANLKYFQLGALGPDLPYSQELARVGPLRHGLFISRAHRDSLKAAKKFHYEKTNQIPLRAFRYIRKLKDTKRKDQLFSFFLGYTSHVVSDAMIHPFVRDKVGNYDENKTMHRILEMRLDVLFLHHLTEVLGYSQNLNTSELYDQIDDPLDTKFNHISSLFVLLIKNIYDLNFSIRDIELWIKGMHEMFRLASTHGNRFYSSFPIIENYLFPEREEILEKAEEDYLLRNSEAVGRTCSFLNRDIHFLDDCVPAFHKIFKLVALEAYDVVYKGKKSFDQNLLPAVNLDTGRCLTQDNGNDLDTKVLFWELL